MQLFSCRKALHCWASFVFFQILFLPIGAFLENASAIHLCLHSFACVVAVVTNAYSTFCLSQRPTILPCLFLSRVPQLLLLQSHRANSLSSLRETSRLLLSSSFCLGFFLLILHSQKSIQLQLSRQLP